MVDGYVLSRRTNAADPAIGLAPQHVRAVLDIAFCLTRKAELSLLDINHGDTYRVKSLGKVQDDDASHRRADKSRTKDVEPARPVGGLAAKQEFFAGELCMIGHFLPQEKYLKGHYAPLNFTCQAV